MGDKSTIEWTDATWNVVTGCTKISPGCANCYIDRTPPFRTAGRKFVDGDIPLIVHADRMLRPVQWKRPRRIFVNSLSDMFHEDLTFEFIACMYATMACAPWHQYQVLTKREEQALAFYEWLGENPIEKCLEQMVGHEVKVMPSDTAWPLPQVWFGMTAENRHWLMTRASVLKRIPAHVRWLSLEPLLEDVSGVLHDVLADGLIHWVVAGLESGPRRRPMAIEEKHRDWIRRIRDVCDEMGVEFLFKQFGGPSAKSGGRELDGRTHDGYPLALIRS